MKVSPTVILLAGGFGTRISEESETRPKPMVFIQGKPILWHLMKIYSLQGYSRFIIATGYKHEVIDEWVDNKNQTNSWEFHCDVETIFTGINTQTGGRVRQVLEIDGGKQFMLTYGDGLANVPLRNLENFHNSHGKVATVTSVRPPARFGHIESNNGLVTRFGEKSLDDVSWINGGFFILNSNILDYLHGDDIPFEQGPMNQLVREGQLMTYRHHGFWQAMDNLHEKRILEELAKLPNPPWLEIPTEQGRF
jgi:glucose-1-phosphate cytidylyltransferase